jgi:hypothetical protein
MAIGFAIVATAPFKAAPANVTGSKKTAELSCPAREWFASAGAA